MAQILDYLVSGSPSLVYNLEANYSRNGAQVVISWNAQFRFPYSNDMLGKGHGLWLRASAGGSSSEVELKPTDTNISYYSTGGDWQEEHTSSFSYTNASAHTCTVTFQGVDTSGYNEFSTSLQLSIPSIPISGPQKVYIGANTNNIPRQIEFMSDNNFSMASWPVDTGQSGDIWANLGAGSWTRGGLSYNYATNKTFSQYNESTLNQYWTTHVYDSGHTTKFGTLDYYPRIYVAYNANGGSGAPSTQTKYIGKSLTISGTKPTKSSVNYSITFNANGGSGAPSNQTYTKTSYSFSNWYTKSNGTGTQVKPNDVITYHQWNSISGGLVSNSGWHNYIPDHNGNTVTLYAKWTTNNYNWTCPSTIPTRSGYQFLGWSTSSSATTATYTAGTTYNNISSNLALYAVWSGTSLSFDVCEGQRDRFYVKVSTTITSITNISVRVHNNADGSSTASDIITSFGTSKEGCANAGGPRRNCTITVTVTGSSTKSVSTMNSTESYVPGEVLLTHDSKNVSTNSVGFTISGLIDNNDINKGDYNVYIVPKQTNYIADAPTMYFKGVLWQRVFKQNCKQGTINFTSASSARDSGQYTTDEKCSFMSRLNNNLKINSKYQFLLIYPNLYNWQTGYNSWRQTNNPIDEYVNPSSGTTTASGYEAVDVSWSAAFGGMTRQNSSTDSINSCYLSGNVGSGNFFYALATSAKWNDRYPIPVEPNHGSNSYNGTWGSAELWIRVPGSVTPIIKPISYDGTTKDITITGLDPNTEYMAFAELKDSTDSSKLLHNFSKLVSFKTGSNKARLRYKREINLNTYLPQAAVHQLEYIKATGTQYINTHYIATKDTSIFVDFRYTDISTRQVRLFGTQTNDTNHLTFAFYINGNGNWAYAYNNGTGNWISTDIPADTNRHTLQFNVDGRVMLDQGLLYNEPIQGTATTSSNGGIILAANNNEDSFINNYSKVCIYQFNIYENGKIMENYIPSEYINTPVMYDPISESVIAGIGGFVAGQSNTITFHEYVNLNPTGGSGVSKAYFNTGYIPNFNSKFIAKFRNTAYSMKPPLFGVRHAWNGTIFPNEYIFWAIPSEFEGGTGVPSSAFNNANKSYSTYLNNTDVLYSICYKDGRLNGEVKTFNATFGSPGMQMPIGGVNTDNVIDSRVFVGYIYYFIIYENNELKHYYIPCSGTAGVGGYGDGNIGLYDIVTRVFIPLYEYNYDLVTGPSITSIEKSHYPIWEEREVKLKDTTWKSGTKVKYKINDTWIDVN